MPNPWIDLAALAAAWAVSALFLLGERRLRHKPSDHERQVAGLAGWALGFAVGCAVMGLRPMFPPFNALGRLFYFVLPAIALSELLLVASRRSPQVNMAVRLLLSIAIPRVLLHGSIYTNGANSVASFLELGTIWGVSSLLLFVTWSAATHTLATASDWPLPAATAVTTLVAGGAILIAGYFAGGETSLALAGTQLGVLTAALKLRKPSLLKCTLALNIVGLFSLIFIGRFFGGLTTFQAILLVLAPLVGEATNYRPLAHLPAPLPRLIRWSLFAVTLILVLVLAVQKFHRLNAVRPQSVAAIPTRVLRESGYGALVVTSVHSDVTATYSPRRRARTS